MITHEAMPGTYRDEPEPLAPLLASETFDAPDEPSVQVVTRLGTINDRVYLFTEDEGGALLDERDLGTLRESLYNDVPRELWNELARMLEDEEDAQRFGRDCRAAAMEYH